MTDHTRIRGLRFHAAARAKFGGLVLLPILFVAQSLFASSIASQLEVSREDLLDALSAGYPPLANAAAIRLAQEGYVSGAVLDGLKTGLSSNNPKTLDQCLKAIGALGERGTPLYPLVAKLLKHKSAWIRTAAGTTLTQMGQLAQQHVPALVEGARTGQLNEYAVTRSLGDLGPYGSEAVPYLVKRFRSNVRDQNILQETVKALQGIGSAAREVIPDLMRLVKESSSQQPLHAEFVKTLGAVGDGNQEVRAYIWERTKEGYWAAYPALADLASRDAALMSSVLHEFPDRLAIAEELANRKRVAPETIAILRASLSSERPTERVFAAEALARMKYPEAGPALVPCLASDGHDQQLYCHRAFLSLESASLPLLKEALHSPDSTTRKHALWVIRELKDSVAMLVPDIIALLADPDPNTKYSAMEALGKLGARLGDQTDTVVAELTETVQSRDQRRYVAMKALGEIGPAARKSLQPLVAQLDSLNQDILYACAVAVAQVGEGDSLALQALLDRLNMALKSSDYQLRWSTIYAVSAALGRWPKEDDRVVAALLNLLRTSEYATHGVRALGILGPRAKTAVPELVKLLHKVGHDENLRIEAANALGRIGPESRLALPVILKEFRTRDFVSVAILVRRISPKAVKQMPLPWDIYDEMRRHVRVEAILPGKAIINGQELHEGQMVKGARIKNIYGGMVEFEYQGYTVGMYSGENYTPYANH